MKNTLITLLYTSLSLLLLAYLFKLLNWPGVSDFSMGIFLLHIAAYIAYSSFVQPKDNRIIYPLVVLVFTILINTFKIGNISSLLRFSFFSGTIKKISSPIKIVVIPRNK